MIEKGKKTRARAPEKKEKQFDAILDLGKDLFLEYGSKGFSLRELSRKLDMAQSNLYNYVESKRELWFAIRNRYFSEYEKGFAKIIKTHNGNNLELAVKWARYFLDFAAADTERFEMMFFVRAPPSDKIGPYEKEYRPLTLVQKGIGLVQRSVAEGENKDADPNGLYFYMYASCLGAAKFEADLKLHFRITNSTSNETNLPSVDEFREFFLKEYRNRLEKAYV